jgi:hypothetical protein
VITSKTLSTGGGTLSATAGMSHLVLRVPRAISAVRKQADYSTHFVKRF